MQNTYILERPSCLICNSHSFKSIFKRSFNEDIIKNYMIEQYSGNADIGFLQDVDFEILKCTECDFAFQSRILTDEKLNELYDQWIDPVGAREWHFNNGGGGDVRVNYYKNLLQYAKSYLKKDFEKIKFLDCGAGFGDSFLASEQLGIDSYAIEYSAERIQFLKEQGVHVIDNDDKTLFDFIIVDQILEHTTYPGEFLDNIYSKLNDNGLVYLAVPNCHSLEKKLKNVDDILDAKELHTKLFNASVGAFQHINFFNNSTLETLIKKHRFEVVFPLKHPFIKPVTLKSFLRPLYHFYYGTVFFLKKNTSNK